MIEWEHIDLAHPGSPDSDGCCSDFNEESVVVLPSPDNCDWWWCASPWWGFGKDGWREHYSVGCSFS
jgi:hypothetical protein